MWYVFYIPALDTYVEPQTTKRVTLTGLEYRQQGWFLLNTPQAPRNSEAGLQRVSASYTTVGHNTSAPQAAANASTEVDVDTGGLLDKIFERPLRFHESDLALSLGPLGNVSRLRRVADKLLKGALCA